MDKDLKIALVHDYFQWYGGAERVLEAISEIFPDAPIFTSVYNPKNMNKGIQKLDIRPSYMQDFPFVKKLLKLYTPLYPGAFESFDFSDYDLVISDSTGVAKSVITGPSTCHVSYIHTPPRFLWGYPTAYQSRSNPILRNFVLPIMNNYLRIWDRWSADRVDYFISNSEEVKARIRKFYLRESKVIYPPVETTKFASEYKAQGKYFLTISRLENFKNVEVAVTACIELRLPLKVIGVGPLMSKLKKLAKEHKNIQFLGKIDDKNLIKYLQNAKALIFPGADDFGIAPVEAMAAGKPVIAFREGGVLETVVEGRTGEFFNNPNAASLKAVLSSFDERRYLSKECIKQAAKFDKEIFKKQFKEYIDLCLKDFRKNF